MQCCPRRARKAERPMSFDAEIRDGAGGTAKNRDDSCGIGASSISTELEERSVESDQSPQPRFESRPLSDEERRQAWQNANFFDATEQAQPLALWILGPSSVGKSTITVDAAPMYSIPRCPTSDDRRRQLDAVTIDGEFMRDAHGLWKEWVQTDDWRSAYPALKAVINKEKDGMCLEAVRRRKNLIIPQTALKLPKAMSEMEDMMKSGYTVHVLAVVAPLAECQRRGRKREQQTGKRYQPSEFQKSIDAIPALVAISNGKYAIVRALEREGASHGMDFELLREGYGGAAASGLSAPTAPLPEMIEAVISKAVEPAACD
ncbi:unnamed protein product [Effrenium voratum]|uniref:Uncharacterized protein n=1 Tax=Effrenium voratum TaxID=2562239 RepID=A0AA36IB43_9DINO|nr:unnamed protein product [Effrenium voratum]